MPGGSVAEEFGAVGGNRLELVHLTSSLDKIREGLVLKRSHAWLHMLYSAKIFWKLPTNICKAGHIGS